MWLYSVSLQWNIRISVKELRHHIATLETEGGNIAYCEFEETLSYF